jgi:hypothetical protein
MERRGSTLRFMSFFNISIKFLSDRVPYWNFRNLAGLGSRSQQQVTTSFKFSSSISDTDFGQILSLAEIRPMVGFLCVDLNLKFRTEKNPSVTQRCRILLGEIFIIDISAAFCATDLRFMMNILAGLMHLTLRILKFLNVLRVRSKIIY